MAHAKTKKKTTPALKSAKKTSAKPKAKHAAPPKKQKPAVKTKMSSPPASHLKAVPSPHKPAPPKQPTQKSPAKPPQEASKPVQKVHPFAAFMKGGNSYRPSHAPMQKFSNHDTYRKKAI